MRRAAKRLTKFQVQSRGPTPRVLAKFRDMEQQDATKAATRSKPRKCGVKRKRNGEPVTRTAPPSGAEIPVSFDWAPPSHMQTEFIISELKQFCLNAQDYNDYSAYLASKQDEHSNALKYPSQCTTALLKQGFRRKTEKYYLERGHLARRKLTRRAKEDKWVYDASTKKRAEKKDKVLVQAGRKINWDKFGTQYEPSEYHERVEVQIVVQPNMIPKIWFDYHESFACYGPEKTANTIQGRYFLTNLNGFCKYACSISPCCQRKDAPAKTVKPPLKQYPVTEHKWQRVHIDFAGPFPTSDRGNRFILIAVDSATRFCEVIALPDQTAGLVCEFLHSQVICRYGMMQIVVHDNGKSFISEYNQRMLEAHNIQRRAITPYRPRGNGAAEAMVKSIKTTLHSLIQKKYRTNKWGPDWCLKLHPAAFAVRASWTKTRKMSPMCALYGREPWLIGDWNAFGPSEEDYEEDIAQSEEKAEKTLERSQEHMAEVYDEMITNYESFQRQQLRNYNKRRGVEYKPKAGDKVLYKSGRKNGMKGNYKWLPEKGFMLIKHVSDGGHNVTLENSEGVELERRFPLDFIRPYKTAEDEVDEKVDDFLSASESEESILSDTEVESEIDAACDLTSIDTLDNMADKFEKALPTAEISRKLSKEIIRSDLKWAYTRNGYNHCAYITVLACMATNEKMMSFFDELEPETHGMSFLQQCLRMFNATMSYSIHNSEKEHIAGRGYKLFLELLAQWLTSKCRNDGVFCSLGEALDILGFNDEELREQMEWQGLLIGQEACVRSCYGNKCHTIYDGELEIGQWNTVSTGNLPTTTRTLCQVESSGYIYAAANILCGGVPNGRCRRCSSNLITLHFRQPLPVYMVTLPAAGLAWYSTFKVQDLKSVPLVDLEGLVHMYETQAVMFQPSDSHFTSVQLDWRGQRCIELESLRGVNGSLRGKAKEHDMEWLQLNSGSIAGLILVKKSRKPKKQKRAFDLVFSATAGCKLTVSDDVQRSNPRALMEFMSQRNIWKLFADVVERKKFYSKRTQVIEGKQYHPGSRLPYDGQELRDLRVPAASYEQKQRTLDSKITDVMVKWCERFEENWHTTLKNPTDKVMEAFKQDMIAFWNSKDASEESIGDVVDLESNVALDTDGVSIAFKEELAIRGLKLTAKQDLERAFIVEGTQQLDESIVSVTVRKNAYRKVWNPPGNHAWYFILLSLDRFKNLEFEQYKPGSSWMYVTFGRNGKQVKRRIDSMEVSVADPNDPDAWARKHFFDADKIPQFIIRINAGAEERRD